MLSRRRATRHFEEFDDGGLAAWDEAAHPEHAAAARAALARDFVVVGVTEVRERSLTPRNVPSLTSRSSA